MGRLNRDCWYLYTLHPERGVTVADQTLELIMGDLDEKVMSIFTQAMSSSAREATQKSGIDKIFAGMQIDDFLFSPCGYSMNGITRSVCRQWQNQLLFIFFFIIIKHRLLIHRITIILKISKSIRRDTTLRFTSLRRLTFRMCHSRLMLPWLRTQSLSKKFYECFCLENLFWQFLPTR